MRATARTCGGLGAGEARDDRRVRAERDHVAGRQRAEVLRHRLVLVDHAAALVEHVADDHAVVDADRADDRGGRVRELRGQPLARLAVAVEELGVDRDPAVARPFDARARSGRAAAGTCRPGPGRRRGRRSGRAARRTTRRALACCSSRSIGTLSRCAHSVKPSRRQASRPTSLLRRHVERQVLDPGCARALAEGGQQRLAHALPAPLGDDVDDVHVRVPARLDIAERVAGRLAVVLGQQHELALEHPRRDLGRRPGPVPVLLEDRAREAEQRRLVGGGRFADVHPAPQP